MVVNETLVYILPEELVTEMSGLINILEAVGIAVFVYVVFSIINALLHRKRNKGLKLINENLEDIKAILSKTKRKKSTAFY
jgi:peroxiredoxin family protein